MATTKKRAAKKRTAKKKTAAKKKVAKKTASKKKASTRPASKTTAAGKSKSGFRTRSAPRRGIQASAARIRQKKRAEELEKKRRAEAAKKRAAKKRREAAKAKREAEAAEKKRIAAAKKAAAAKKRAEAKTAAAKKASKKKVARKKKRTAKKKVTRSAAVVATPAPRTTKRRTSKGPRFKTKGTGYASDLDLARSQGYTLRDAPRSMSRSAKEEYVGKLGRQKARQRAGEVVTAAQLLREVKSSGLKAWVCMGPRRTGCGGGSATLAGGRQRGILAAPRR